MSSNAKRLQLVPGLIGTGLFALIGGQAVAGDLVQREAVQYETRVTAGYRGGPSLITRIPIATAKHATEMADATMDERITSGLTYSPGGRGGYSFGKRTYR